MIGGQKMKSGLLAIIVAIALTEPAQSDSYGFLDGQDLHDSCKHDSIATDAYVMGVLDSIFETKQLAEDSRAKGQPIGISELLAEAICLPPGVTGETLGDVVCKYLAENPSQRPYGGQSIVWTAITSAYGKC
jgi:hypothetical protein